MHSDRLRVSVEEVATGYIVTNSSHDVGRIGEQHACRTFDEVLETLNTLHEATELTKRVRPENDNA